MKDQIVRTSSSATRKASGLVAAGFAALILTLSGCSYVFNPPQTADTVWTDAIPESFDFATVRSVDFKLTVSVRVATAIERYSGELGVYSIGQDGEYVLLGSGFAADGVASFPVSVPVAVTQVTIRPLSVGLFEREVTLAPGADTFERSISPTEIRDPTARKVASRSLARDTAETPLQSISKYDSEGVPTDILQERPYMPLSGDFLATVGQALSEINGPDRANYIDEHAHSNINITAPSKITVSFLHEKAANANALAYYVYTTGSAATKPANASLMVAFPNVSLEFSGGGLKPGDSITLVYHDSRTNTDSTTFPAGSTIGWVLVPNSFRNGQPNASADNFYSTPQFNPESESSYRAHTAFVLYKSSEAKDTAFVLGFEDSQRTEKKPGDFTDAVFAISSSPISAVETTDVIAAPAPRDSDGDGVLDANDASPYDASYSSTVSWPSATINGTALFEDRWPSLGDYDFNDLVASFRVTTRKNAADKAVSMIIDLSLKAAGGGLPSGLALTLPVSASSIASVSGQHLGSGLFSTAANGVESDAPSSSSVVPIFSDSHTEFGVAGSLELRVNTLPSTPSLAAKTYQLVITFNPGVAASPLAATPDLFIVVDNNRGKEVHAMGQHPGSKADLSLLRTADDGSSLSEGIYYRSSKGAPWALLVPAEMPWPIEGVEISTAFLKFGAWVKSGGSQYSDWYLDKAGYRNTDLLYSAVLAK
ncbi:MAG: LruC domain-containing protein [Rectinemataceae bacterium]